MKVSVVIVSFNTRQLLDDCIKSIEENSWRHQYQIIVVDNNSTDGSVEMVKKKYPKTKLILNSSNEGFGAANNQALEKVDTPYALLLNSDTVVLPDSLDNLVDQAENNNWGISSCKLLNSDRSLQPNCGDLPVGIGLLNWITGADGVLTALPSFHRTNSSFYKGDKVVGWVSGSVMLISRDVIDKVGLFDKRIFMYAEDTDLCWRANNKGFKVGWTDKGQIIHLGGKSSANPSYTQWLGEFKGLVYLYRKNFGALAASGVQLLMKLFILVRIIAYLIFGKGRIAQTYGKILFAF